MALRPPSTPRAPGSSTGLPPPGSTPSALPFSRRKSGIPLTPSATFSSAGTPTHQLDSLREALRNNDPARWTSDSASSLSSTGGDDRLDSPTPGESSARTARRRPSMVAMRSSLSRPVTPSFTSSRAPPVPALPSASSSQQTSVVKLEVGDPVKIEVAGVHMEGTLRFLGEVEGKDGHWGGVELDPEWEGKGKNDGSVRGTQYFACPPACGLFLPLSKIVSKFVAPLPVVAGSRPPPILTAGSRASKYARLTASDLATNPPSPLVKPQFSLSSPTKPKPPSTPTSGRAAISPSIAVTPKPRLPRPSFGASTGTTPRASIGRAGLPATGRKSIGPGGTVTPRRPPSSLRSIPPPPLPTTTPTATSRRMSLASSSTGGAERSTTPSLLGRSSRASFVASETSEMGRRSVLGRSTPVRSYSRQSDNFSSRSLSVAGSASEDVRDAREREMEVRSLLEASERVGREVEERLAAREKELRDARERVSELEDRERNRDEADAREREAQRARDLATQDGDESAADRLAMLEGQLADFSRRESVIKAATDRLTREWDTKFAAKEGEIESLRERLAVAEDERAELHVEVEKLRSAGQALCATYEERISEIEASRLDVVERLEAMYDRDRPQADHDGASSSESSSFSPSARLGNSLGSSHTSAADVINAENALADLEHLRSKVATLEEQLEEAKMHLDVEVNEARRRRQKAAETEQDLKKDAKALRETIERSAKTEARLTARIEELEAALVESQTALENERSELEGLRHDGTAQAGLADEVTRSNKELVKLKAELARSTDLVVELRNDLRGAEKELDKYHQRRTDSLLVGGASTPVQQPTQDTSNLMPSPQAHRRDSAASNGSRRSLGPKDDATATREQIVGLKVIIQSMTEENHQLSDRNKALMVEAQELRDAQRALEATVKNMMAEMGSSGPPTATVQERRDSAQLISNVPLQREVDELRLKVKESERRAEREIKALNQEVNELEALVESKIYREDELEAEIEKYKKLAGVDGSHINGRSNAGSKSSGSKSANSKSLDNDEELACEMCGEVGHDLDGCPIFGGSTMAKTPSAKSTASGPWCDDCEEYGHSLDECPLANEIF